MLFFMENCLLPSSQSCCRSAYGTCCILNDIVIIAATADKLKLIWERLLGHKIRVGGMQ